MLPQASAWAAARDFWIFGGFLRFLTRSRKGPEQLDTVQIRRAAVQIRRAAVQRAAVQIRRAGSSGPVIERPGFFPDIAGR